MCNLHNDFVFLCPPPQWGHIIISVDPVSVGFLVGVGILVGVAFRLHSISLMNGWILAKLTQVYHLVGGKYWLDFDDRDPIIKVTRGLRLFEKAGKLLICTQPPEGTNGFWPYLHI